MGVGVARIGGGGVGGRGGLLLASSGSSDFTLSLKLSPLLPVSRDIPSPREAPVLQHAASLVGPVVAVIPKLELQTFIAGKCT